MKIGIVTMYNNNFNYGGNLQAYALCRLCNEMGYEAYQIDYRNSSIIRFTLSSAKQFVLSLGEKNKNIENRKRIIKSFNRTIPHSKVYYKNTIQKANKEYDCFIAGSDQIWNPKWINQAFSLSFCDNTKYKFSYAASIGRTEINSAEKNIFLQFLKNYDGVSVREKNSVSLLADLSPVQPQWVLDPTFLLSKEDWDSVCDNSLLRNKYIFCYFLRDDIGIRNIAEEYAKYYNLKIVTLPFLSNTYRMCDDGFGDYQFFEVSPYDFVSLIKNSECVFTDSFHAVAFSCIYQKQFYVINDSKMGAMGDRINTLLCIFKSEDHFLLSDAQKNFDYINELPKIPYEKYQNKFDEIKNQSLFFLKANLERANEQRKIYKDSK